MTLTIDLSPEAESHLRNLAAQAGQTPEGYVRNLVEDSLAGTGIPALLSAAELDRLLDEFSEGLSLPSLPPDFSRADLYADHD